MEQHGTRQKDWCLVPLPASGFGHKPRHSHAAVWTQPEYNVCWCMAVCSRSMYMRIQSVQCVCVSMYSFQQSSASYGCVQGLQHCAELPLQRWCVNVSWGIADEQICIFPNSNSPISLLALNLFLPPPSPFPLYNAGSSSSWHWELFSCFKSQFENVKVQILEREVWVLKARMFFLIRVMPSSSEKPLCFYSSSVLVPKPFTWSD